MGFLVETSSMGKKRSADQVQDGGFQENRSASKPPKKIKGDKKIIKKVHEGSAAPSTSTSMSFMEKKKKRKALDKERHRSSLVNLEQKSKNMSADERQDEIAAPTVSSKSGDLPEFHINVFKDLVSSEASVREAGVESLVKELQEVQKAYDQLEKKDLVNGGLKLEAEKDDGLNDCAPSLRYAIRRLIRGVSSSRECARQGFALGLALLVDTIPSIKVDAILKLSVDLLEVSSSMKGQEVKDCLLGRLFVYGALSRTSRMVNEWLADKSTPCIKEYTSIILSLSAKKRYLQEPAVCILLELIEKLPSEAVLTHIVDSTGIAEWFEGANVTGNSDALLLALKIHEKIGHSHPTFGRLLPDPFSPSKFFAADHLSFLANCFKESTFCQPRVHSLWPMIVSILLPEVVIQEEDATVISSSLKKHRKGRKSSPSEEETSKNLQSFCEVVIEGSLLPSSHDRKHLALDILLLLLPRLPASLVPIVLSYKVVQCLVDALSTKNSWLFKVVQHFMKELSNWVSKDDVRRVLVIVSLQKHSNGQFDLITQMKTVKNLVMDFQTESGAMLFIQSLTNMFVDDGPTSEEPSDQSQTTDENLDISTEDKDSSAGSSDFLKCWIVESIPNVLKNMKLDSEAKFRVQKEVMKFLAVQGLFTASLGSEITSFELQEKFRWPKSATSSNICKLCIEQLQSLLAMALKGETVNALINTAENIDLGAYFVSFLSTLRNIPSVSLFRYLSEDDDKVFKELQEMEIRAFREERNSGINAQRLHSLRYLLIQLLLQILLHPGEFVEAASELIICCKKTFDIPDILESGDDDDSGTEEEPVLVDVLVDTLLSLLPQSSAPMRSTVEQVFKNVCSEISGDVLDRMLRVIKKDLKPARHQDVENLEEDEDDEDFLAIEEEEGEMGDTAGSDGLTDDSEGVMGSEQNDDGEDSDGSEDSDEGMDDDAMFRMDTYLAQIFKERKSQGGNETAHSQLILFKLRVLSLLEIYLHENPGKPQVLMVYSSLARAFVSPSTAESSEQLSQRIWGILQKKIFKAKEYPKGELVQLSFLESLLEKNLRWASKPFKKKPTSNSSKKQSAPWNRHKLIVSLAQNSVHWILKIIDARNYSRAELQKVISIFQTVVAGYFDSKKSQIKTEFLKEIFQRRPWIGGVLFAFILEKCSLERSEFRRVDALDLITEILRHIVPSDMNEQNHESSKKILKSHLNKLSHLISGLVTNMPKKKSRRSDVRKFCTKVFQVVSSVNLTQSFLKGLSADAQIACETQLGNLFVNLKKVKS
ncbi:hypothetical protein SAY87_006270 [Trapa incisa]|uniref:DNA polymerase V n=1 Tax=Trapa incisa TaxID=236973 RepID=A0AAN7K2F8_9MYRT|nr:hypothetical protein SAY87_006270 [Trapa incisa]